MIPEGRRAAFFRLTFSDVMPCKRIHRLPPIFERRLVFIYPEFVWSILSGLKINIDVRESGIGPFLAKR